MNSNLDSENKEEESKNQSRLNTSPLSSRSNDDVNTGNDQQDDNNDEDEEEDMPCELLRMIHETSPLIDWEAVSQYVRAHPEEVLVVNRKQLNALHAALYGYASPSTLRTMIEVAPQSARHSRATGELPLHVACYTATEDIQSLILETYPEATAVQDVYGDSPLHYAVRHGASFRLLKRIVRACPRAVSFENMQRETPLSEMCHTYYQAETFQDILDDRQGFIVEDFCTLMLFLRASYSSNTTFELPDTSQEWHRQQLDQSPPRSEEGGRRCTEPLDATCGEWMVHAAVSTQACPLDSIRCLCRMFPEQAHNRDSRGMTPLLLACEVRTSRRETSDDGTSNGNQTSTEGEDQEATTSNNTESQSRTATTNREDSGGDGDGGRPNAAANTSTGNSASGRSEGSVISILLEWDKTAAEVPDLQGRYPLAHAIRSDKPAHAIKMLLGAHPDALEFRANFDDEGGPAYPMFFLAALYSQDIDVVYQITRMDPHFQETVRGYC